MDKKIKERIFGGAIILSLCIIATPMILSENPHHRLSVPKAAKAPEWPNKEKLVEKPQSLQKLQQEALENDTTALHPKKMSKEAVRLGSWVIRAGIFKSAENAKNLEQKLLALGFPAYTKPFGKNKELVAVLIGPVIKKEDAVQMQKKLQQLGQVKGTIEAHHPI